MFPVSVTLTLLQGVVNKLALNHAGCLVHGCFNASIPKPSLVTVETWRENGPEIGAELEFLVSQLDADTAGVMLIRGMLDRTRCVCVINMKFTVTSVL